MSVMSTTPVFKCRGCGALVAARVVETYRPDPEGHLLRQIMQGLSKVALCADCKQRELYYSGQGRLNEFRVMVAPNGQLVAVRDRRKDDPEWQRLNGSL